MLSGRTPSGVIPWLCTLGRHETTGLMEMKQVGLIDQVIETLGLNDGMAKGKCLNYLINESNLLHFH